MADIRRIKLPNGTTYNVKDNTARTNITNITNGTTKLPYGKALSITNVNELNLLDPNNNVLSTVNIPGGGNKVYNIEALTYSGGQWEFNGPENFNPQPGDLIIFSRATSSPKFIDFEDEQSLEIIDSYTDNTYNLYTLGTGGTNKVRYLSTACNIVAVVTEFTDEWQIISIQPVYKDTTFVVRNNILARPASSTTLNNVGTDNFAYLYSYSNETDITIYDQNNTDITSKCTVWVARGITTKNTYQTEIYVQTTTNTRIKSIVLDSNKYGMPTSYKGSSNYIATITGCTGFFVNESVANLGEDKSKWTITNYSYLASTSTGTLHSILCI